MGLIDLLRLLRPEEVAERIASGKLDMRPEAVAERREALFPETFYSGSTSPDILENPPTIMAPQYLWASESPGVASSYSGRRIGRRPDEAPTIYPLAVNTEGFDRVLGGGATWNTLRDPTILRGSERISMEDIATNTEELLDFAYESGVPGVLFQDVIDPGPYQKLMNLGVPSASGGRASQREIDEFLQELERNPPLNMAVPDTTRVRAKYGAAFDPDYTGPNILGGAAGTAALAGLLADPEEAEAGVIQRVIDPRFTLAVGAGGEGSIRKGLMDRIETMGFDVEDRPLYTGDTLSLADLEGRPYIITQSDRSRAGGVLTGIDGTPIDPVDLRGGRDFMFENPGMVWASDPKVVSGLMGRAEELRRLYGSNPILLPYSMAPTGIDYATMPLDTMINFARAEMSRTNKKKLDAGIRKIIPEWGGVDDPMSNSVFRDVVGDKRKAVEDFIDKNFRNERGGLSIAEARVATSSPEQFEIIDGGLLNIGEIDPTKPIIADSGHPTYLAGLPGMGLGRLPEVISARPQMAVRGRDVKNDPSDIRSLSMRPEYGQGQIDEELLRAYYGRATPEMLAATAAGTGAALAAPGLINMAADEPLEKPTAGDVMDSVFNILDMPMAGLQGLVRTGYGLATGESLLDALAEGVHITQQGPDYGADRFEQYITEKTGDPSLGWMGKMGLLFGAPF